MASSRGEIRVAVAHGPGAGRFLAMALVDALQSGVPLVAVSASRTSGPAHRVGVTGVDFVFHQEDAEREEVIRAGLRQDGRVVSAEILRRVVRMRYAPYQAADELLAAVRSGQAVAELHWQYPPDTEPRGILSITMRADHRFQIACGPLRNGP